MLSYALEAVIVVLLIYLTLAGLYQFFLAVSYYFTKDPVLTKAKTRSRFAIIAPAHNEELLIGAFCQSLNEIDYDDSLYDVYVIADNCTDGTVEACRNYDVAVLERHNMEKVGKGYALEWAIENIDIDKYDAVIVLDADTTVNKSLLTELNILLNNGEKVIQCYIEVPNKSETWFTQLISLSRTINDKLYHYAKYKLGLSAYLMGTGMCFDRKLLQELKWNAFTLSEDWEYYAKLVHKNYRVAFSNKGIIYQMESNNLQQATSQRLRWASGRFYVVKNLGFSLLLNGLKKRNLVMIDASMALLLPNWSLQINLIILTSILVLILPDSQLRLFFIMLCVILLLMQGLIVVAGVSLSKNTIALVKAIMLAPVFLLWKFVIDVLCLTKLYKGKEWIRTKRHIPINSDDNK